MLNLTRSTEASVNPVDIIRVLHCKVFSCAFVMTLILGAKIFVEVCNYSIPLSVMCL